MLIWGEQRWTWLGASTAEVECLNGTKIVAEKTSTGFVVHNGVYLGGANEMLAIGQAFRIGYRCNMGLPHLLSNIVGPTDVVQDPDQAYFIRIRIIQK